MDAHRPRALVGFFTVVVLAVTGIPISAQSFNVGSPTSGGTAASVQNNVDTTLMVDGDPGDVYALASSLAGANIATPFGTLGLDLAHPSFSILVDGFNPGNPTWSYGHLGPAGYLLFTFQPFPTGVPLGSAIRFQAVRVSPYSPAPIELSNTSLMTCTAAPPVITGITPNVTSPGGAVVIAGQYLGGVANGGNPPTVTCDGILFAVTSHGEDFVEVIVPESAVSGNLRVQTISGSTPLSSDSITAFVVISNAIYQETSTAATVLTTPVSVEGDIDWNGDEDFFDVALTEGDEVLIECLPIDLTTYTVFSYAANFYGQFIDPEIAIMPISLSNDILMEDNNGGPGFAAAIGVGVGPRFFVPATGVYRVRVRSAFGFTNGNYFLNIRTRDNPTISTPKILALYPNSGVVGNEVDVLAWGVDTMAPGQHLVRFPTASGPIDVTPYVGQAGLLRAALPPGVITGHIQISNAAGVFSEVLADDYSSNFFVWGMPGLEDPAPGAEPILSGETKMGTITSSFELDLYTISLVAGDAVTIRVYPYDAGSAQILRGALFSPTTLDPEILVQNTNGQGLFATDVHSGPGYSAEIGGPLVPRWIVPTTQTYQIAVRAWFYLSAGSYVLDVRVN